MPRINFNGRQFRIGQNILYPYTYHGYNYTSKQFLPPEGYLIEFLKTAAKVLNFNYTLVHAGQQWGKRMPDGSFDGLVGMVSRREVDVGVDGLSYSIERDEVIDYSWPYAYDHITIVSRRSASTVSVYAAVEPFNWDTWVGICLSALFMVLVHRYFISPKGKSDFFTLLTLFLNQSLEDRQLVRKAQSTPEKLYWGSWLAATAFFVYSYQEALIGFLTFPYPALTIDRFFDLAIAIEKGDIKPKCVEGDIIYKVLTTSTDHEFRVIGKELSTCAPVRTCFELVMDWTSDGGPYAMITNRDVAEVTMQGLGRHNFHMPPPSASSPFSDLLGMIFPKCDENQQQMLVNQDHEANLSSPCVLKSAFNGLIIEIWSAGLFKFWRDEAFRRVRRLEKWIDQVVRKQDEEDEEEEKFKEGQASLELVHYRVPLLIHLFASMVGACVLIAARLFSSFSRLKEQRFQTSTSHGQTIIMGSRQGENRVSIQSEGCDLHSSPIKEHGKLVQCPSIDTTFVIREFIAEKPKELASAFFTVNNQSVSISTPNPD